MLPSRWFAVGSADGSQRELGVRAGMRRFTNQTLVVLSIG
jgi:hypothetical protein